MKKKFKYLKDNKAFKIQNKKFKRKRNYNQMLKESQLFNKNNFDKEKKLDYIEGFNKIKTYFKEKNVSYKRSNSMDEIINQISKINLTDKILINEKTNENKKIINKSKKQTNYNLNGFDITNDINLIDDTIKDNIPYTIIYHIYIFRIQGANPNNSLRATWYCQYYRKRKIYL